MTTKKAKFHPTHDLVRLSEGWAKRDRKARATIKALGTELEDLRKTLASKACKTCMTNAAEVILSSDDFLCGNCTRKVLEVNAELRKTLRMDVGNHERIEARLKDLVRSVLRIAYPMVEDSSLGKEKKTWMLGKLDAVRKAVDDYDRAAADLPPSAEERLKDAVSTINRLLGIAYQLLEGACSSREMDGISTEVDGIRGREEWRHDAGR